MCLTFDIRRLTFFLLRSASSAAAPTHVDGHSWPSSAAAPTHVDGHSWPSSAAALLFCFAALLSGLARADWAYDLHMQDGALPIYIQTNGVIAGNNGFAYNLRTVAVVANGATNQALPAVIVGANATIVSNLHDPSYTTLRVGPLTNTYVTTDMRAVTVAAPGLATNIPGTYFSNSLASVYTAIVWPATNIGAAWYFGAPSSNSFYHDSSGDGDAYDMTVTFVGTNRYTYWILLRQTNSEWTCSYWTNLPGAAAVTCVFAAVDDATVAGTTNLWLHRVTNDIAPVVFLRGATDAGGNWITNLAMSSVPSGAATKGYVDVGDNEYIVCVTNSWSENIDWSDGYTTIYNAAVLRQSAYVTHPTANILCWQTTTSAWYHISGTITTFNYTDGGAINLLIYTNAIVVASDNEYSTPWFPHIVTVSQQYLYNENRVRTFDGIHYCDKNDKYYILMKCSDEDNNTIVYAHVRVKLIVN